MEGVLVDDGLEVALDVDSPLGVADAPAVEGMAQQDGEGLLAHLVAMPCSQAGRGYLAQDLLLRIEAGRIELEGAPYERGGVWIRLDRLDAVRSPHVQIAQRRWERPLPTLEGLLHPENRSLCSLVVVKLRKRRQYALHQLAGRAFVDRLRCRPQRDVHLRQVSPNDVMVVPVPGEAIERVHDQYLDPPVVFHGSSPGAESAPCGSPFSPILRAPRRPDPPSSPASSRTPGRSSSATPDSGSSSAPWSKPCYR